MFAVLSCKGERERETPMPDVKFNLSTNQFSNIIGLQSRVCKRKRNVSMKELIGEVQFDITLVTYPIYAVACF